MDQAGYRPTKWQFWWRVNSAALQGSSGQIQQSSPLVSCEEVDLWYLRHCDTYRQQRVCSYRRRWRRKLQPTHSQLLHQTPSSTCSVWFATTNHKLSISAPLEKDMTEHFLLLRDSLHLISELKSLSTLYQRQKRLAAYKKVLAASNVVRSRRQHLADDVPCPIGARHHTAGLPKTQRGCPS